MMRYSNAFAGHFGCVLVAFQLLGCGSAQRQPDTFGFITDCPDGNWEACRRRHNSLDRASIESFEKMLNQTFEDAWAYSPSHQSVSRKLYDLQIVRDPHRAFLFEATRLDRGGDEIRVVRTSSETFATITKITMARHFYGLKGFGQEWLAHYLLYMRKTPDTEPIVDPLRASGLITMDGKVSKGAPDFTDAIRQGINDTYAVVTFMVAHEIYHLDNPFECVGSGEKCAPALRLHEADADAFAIDVLGKLAAKDADPAYRLAVPAYVFSQLMLVVEGENTRVPINPAEHPPDHERLRSAALALQKWIVSNPGKDTDGSLRALTNQALKIVGDIDAEGPVAYFAGIDQEAASVTLASLKVF